MSFTQANRREVEALLSKLTTTGDASGRMARDIGLVLRLNPHWDSQVRSALGSVYNDIIGQLTVLAASEVRMADVLNVVAPQEDS